MEKHSCKLCHRRFSNGRALGGHMRSHIPSSKPHHHHHNHDNHHHDNHHQDPSSSFSATVSDEVEVERSKPSLRENPKKSFRFIEMEINRRGDSSIVLESEGESSKPTSFRRRPKRRRTEPGPEPEPVSSVSDTTPDEDVARCLMMLSRDVWPNKGPLTTAKPRRRRNKYRCETCNKVFRSHQALGGHRASHKNDSKEEREEKEEELKGDSEVNFSGRKIHECPVCFKVFGSGQALGGHKRSHLGNPAQVQVQAEEKKEEKEKMVNLFDLNLMPAEEEGELSAVLDDDF